MDVTKLLRNRKSHETSDNYDDCGRKVDITSINCTRLVVPNSLSYTPLSGVFFPSPAPYPEAVRPYSRWKKGNGKWNNVIQMRQGMYRVQPGPLASVM